MPIFNAQILKHHYALVPLVGITGIACALCGSYVTYMAVTKNDLSWHPSDYNTRPPYRTEKVGAEDVNKFMNMHKGKIARLPLIESLRAEIGSAS